MSSLTPVRTQRLEGRNAELEARAARDMYGEGVDPAQCRYDVSLWSVRGSDVVERAVNGSVPELPAGESDPRLTVRAVYELPALRLLADDTASYTAASAIGQASRRRASA